MLFFKRRRLVFWLIKAYIKQKGKTLLLFFLLGCVIFFLLNLLFRYVISQNFLIKQERIGIVGAYTLDNLPSSILSNVSIGLTTLSDDDTPKPGIAKTWFVEQKGKVYKFDLRNDLYFADGTNVTSKDINYHFSGVKIEKPSPYAIIFRLQDSYSPFLVTLSHPILKGNYIGVGEYKVKNIKLNGNFVQSIQLVSRKNSLQTKTYQFYPTLDAVKSAYVLGEINEIEGISDITYKNTSFDTYNNTTVKKITNTNQLVTLFYNTQDANLSNNQFREALTYALPNVFPQGQRTYSPYPPGAWFSQNDQIYAKPQDFTHAQLLLQAAFPKQKGPIKITLKTFPEYKETAEVIKKNWAKVGVETTIQEVTSIPGNYQAFLYAYTPPKDPDQYVLWHSGQPNNISTYKNLRIDKLLEDGRKTTDIAERKAIYANFEKYLIDDAPASFLYFPNEYVVEKK